MITAQGWSFRYPGRGTPVLHDVSFTIGRGELVVLMGASGSGKSTLLQALAGTLPEGASGRLEVATQRVGLVQQEPESNVVMERVGDELAFPLENAAVPPDRIQARVAATGLPVAQRTLQLSGGQQQLLAIEAAAIAEPDLLLLDEPTANLDPTAAQRITDAVRELRQRTGCTVVVVEHRVRPWLEMAEQVLLVHDGTVRSIAPREVPLLPLDIAQQVWLDRGPVVRHSPARKPGRVVLQADSVAVGGRLAPVSVSVRSGEVVALVGPPGAGKSTLLACLAGLHKPDEGRVAVAGRGLPWVWPARDIAATFGVVFQNPEHQFVARSAADELRHGLRAAGVDPVEAGRRTAGMLERLHLAPLAGADPFTLSGGEQRRLSVGTALVLHPTVLLLDEPTFGQDPLTWAEVVSLIAAHRDAGGAVIMATHDPAVVEALAARTVELEPVPPAAAATERRVPLRALDPLALIGTAMLLSVAGLLSASPALNVGLALASLLAGAFGGLRLRRTALLTVPVLLAAVGVGVSNALLSSAGLRDPEAWAAAALPASRVLAVAMPGLVAAACVDPTALADALVVRLRVPARAAYAVLAGLRLLPLLAREWRILATASRARGLAGQGLRGRVDRFLSMSFRLLVAALRRGQRLALALDARGLRPRAPRTVARPPRWQMRDNVALLFGILLLAQALATR